MKWVRRLFKALLLLRDRKSEWWQRKDGPR